jgi:hypothetical protein
MAPFKQQSVHSWRQNRWMFVIRSTFSVNGIVVCVKNYKKSIMAIISKTKKINQFTNKNIIIIS